MGREPYKFDKRGVVILLNVSTFNHEKSTSYVDSNSIPLNQLTANNYSNDNVKLTCQHL